MHRLSISATSSMRNSNNSRSNSRSQNSVQRYRWHWSPRMQSKVRQWKNLYENVWLEPFSKDMDLPMCIFNWTNESMTRIEDKLETLILEDCGEDSKQTDLTSQVDQVDQLTSSYLEWREDVSECLASIIVDLGIAIPRVYRRNFSRYTRLRIGRSLFSRSILEIAWNYVENPVQEAIVCCESVRQAAVLFCHAFTFARHILCEQSKKNDKAMVEALRKLDTCYTTFEKTYVRMTQEREEYFDRLLTYTLKTNMEANHISKESVINFDPSIIVALPRLAVIDYCIDLTSAGSESNECFQSIRYRHCLLGASIYCKMEELSELSSLLHHYSEDQINILKSYVLEKSNVSDTNGNAIHIDQALLDNEVISNSLVLKLCRLGDSMLQGRQSPYTTSLQRVLREIII